MLSSDAWTDRLFFKNLEEVKAFRFHSNGIEATGFDDCIVASFARVRRWQPSAEVTCSQKILARGFKVIGSSE
jgi:hypothetical protein